MAICFGLTVDPADKQEIRKIMHPDLENWRVVNEGKAFRCYNEAREWILIQEGHSDLTEMIDLSNSAPWFGFTYEFIKQA